jgi:hypothetical protein
MLLLAIATGVGVIGLREDKAAIGGMALAAATMLLITWIRYAGVTAAGRHYRAGRKSSAWRELTLVPFRGRVLEKSHRAYYHLLRAACLLDREEWAAVIPECNAVLALERVKAANHSTAHGALGQAELHLGNLDRAEDHLRKARDIPHKPATDRLLQRLEDGLAQARKGD